MARYKALVTFKGKKENRIYKKGEEFEMLVKRSDEITENIRKKYQKYKNAEIMERLDD